MLGAHVRAQAGVVGQGIEALLLQPVGDFLGLFARQAVDDAGVLRVFILEKSQQLLLRVVLQGDAITDIGPVKPGDKLSRMRPDPVGR